MAVVISLQVIAVIAAKSQKLLVFPLKRAISAKVRVRQATISQKENNGLQRTLGRTQSGGVKRAMFVAINDAFGSLASDTCLMHC